MFNILLVIGGAKTKLIKMISKDLSGHMKSNIKQKNQLLNGLKKLKFFFHQMNLLSFTLIIQERA